MSRLRSNAFARFSWHCLRLPKFYEPECRLKGYGLCQNMDASEYRAFIHFVNEISPVAAEMNSICVVDR